MKLSARGLGSCDRLMQDMQGARVTWLGDKDCLATRGSSKMSDHQVTLWETGALGHVKSQDDND